MRIVFMGSPDFAVPSLKELYQAGHEIVGVFTQPDKPKGRGKELAPTPVKNTALELGLQVFTPSSIKNQEALDLLKKLAPEVIVVVAYGKILPPEVITLPKFGCINVHASLLPKYRGAAPIHRSIIEGEAITGVTTMYMDVGLDTGDMIYKIEVPIQEDDIVGSIHDKLAYSGAGLIVKTLEDIKHGIAPRSKQDDSLATYAGLLTKADEKIDWTKPARAVFNHVRGMNPFPGTFTSFRDENLKIWMVQEEQTTHQKKPGQVLIADAKKGLLVACGSGAVWLTTVQPKSGKRMSGDAFVRGYKLSEGEILG